VVRRRVVASAIVVFVPGVLAACTSFSSGDGTAGPAEAGAESGVDAGDAAAADEADAAARFFCPPPAGSCTFLGEVCCFGSVDGGVYGTCAKVGQTCPPEDGYALCDSPGPCRSLYDGAASATCCGVNGNLTCAPNACPTEACNPTVQPAECTDASVCGRGGYGFGICM
jgi:hypothetical protein